MFLCDAHVAPKVSAEQHTQKRGSLEFLILSGLKLPLC